MLIDLPPDLPRVMADRPRVEQVLNNLLANAARQAPESSPIRVAAERDGVHVAVSVADEGAGALGAAPDRTAPRQGGKPDAILVVDDDPQTLRHVRDTLAEAGYSPLVTGDHGELAAIIRAEKPALVLLDLMLPGTNGIKLKRTVPELADLPVIFISGYGRDETIARALEAGAADYTRLRRRVPAPTCGSGARLREAGGDAAKARFVAGEAGGDV